MTAYRVTATIQEGKGTAPFTFYRLRIIADNGDEVMAKLRQYHGKGAVIKVSKMERDAPDQPLAMAGL